MREGFVLCTIFLTLIKKEMDNNDVFKKLRVALQLKDDEIIEILKLVDFEITKSELGCIFSPGGSPEL